MAKRTNKKVNKVNNVYYAKLVFYTGETFLDQIKVNVDYDLYNSFKKLPNGDYYLNEKNEKLITKTLNRFSKQALENENLHINFHTDANLGIGFNKCECGAKHTLITNIICDGLSFPEGQCFILGLQFTNKEEC